MRRLLWISLAMLLAAAALAAPHRVQAAGLRIAFVAGNAAYPKAPLKSALNDAGLVAEALRSIGFEVVEGADLKRADLLHAYREFLAKLAAGGPDTVAFVYVSGLGGQFDGENFLLGVDAKLERDADLPSEGVRLADLIGPLAAAPGAAKVAVIDAARPLPFAPEAGAPLRGLAAVEAPPGMLIAFSASPGMAAEDAGASYGPYAAAIAEMLREPGADLETVFVRIRSRTHQVTQGQQTPWHLAALNAPTVLVPSEAVPQAAAAPLPRTAGARRPLRDIGAEEAYAYAIEADTLPAYAEFVEAYPESAYAPRLWAIIRARREALAWMRAVQLDKPEAYWTYLRRYPDGVYAPDAGRRLTRLNAPARPLTGFAPAELYDVPPALPGEPVEFVTMLPAAPAPPAGLIAPPAGMFKALPPPRRAPRMAGYLPIPVVIPLAAGSLRRAGPPAKRFAPAAHLARRQPASAASAPAHAPAAAPAVAAHPRRPLQIQPTGSLTPTAPPRRPSVAPHSPGTAPVASRPPAATPATIRPSAPSGTAPTAPKPPAAATRPAGSTTAVARPVPPAAPPGHPAGTARVPAAAPAAPKPTTAAAATGAKPAAPARRCPVVEGKPVCPR